MRVARSIVVLTGAGISADSGIPTFRGPDGLWEGHRVEDVATPAAWRRDPRRVWGFYQRRRQALLSVVPNPAHRALAVFEDRAKAGGVGFLLVTQNVDDLHARAGSSPLSMHGELAVLRCERCGHRERDLARFDPDHFLACPACGFERLRPDVVWFHEIPYGLERIEAAVGACTDFLALGTSGVVYPAAGYLALARESGARTIVQSLDRPENLHPADRFLPGHAKDAVPALLDGLARELGLP